MSMAHMTKLEPRSILTVALFTIYALLLTGIILFKFPFSYDDAGGTRVVNLVPLMGSFTETGVLRYGELIENVLIFVPFGIYICMVKGNWSFWKKTLLFLAVTVTFETIQYIFAIGRADITDVLGNTLGGIIGIGVYALLSRVLKNRTNGVVNVVALILTVFVLGYSAFLWSRGR
jgi:glycopeptide antibiotics resistance protein